MYFQFFKNGNCGIYRTKHQFWEIVLQFNPVLLLKLVVFSLFQMICSSKNLTNTRRRRLSPAVTFQEFVLDQTRGSSKSSGVFVGRFGNFKLGQFLADSSATVGFLWGFRGISWDMLNSKRAKSTSVNTTFTFTVASMRFRNSQPRCIRCRSRWIWFWLDVVIHFKKFEGSTYRHLDLHLLCS